MSVNQIFAFAPTEPWEIPYLGDPQPYLEKAMDGAGKVLLVIIALIVVFRIGARIERRIRTTLEARSFDHALTLFFASLAKWLLVVAAIVACLGVFGIQTATFAAILGAAGLAVGLAFQGTLSNFASGVLLLTFRPFTIGDFVDIAGTMGTVAEIGLFVTTLDTPDNRRIILSNSAVSSAQIINFSHHSHRRVDLLVGVAYDADLDKTRQVLEDVATNIPGRDDERGHQILMAGLGASSVDYHLRVWCRKEDYWSVWDALHVQVKKALDANDISIPFPQMDVHVQRLPEPASANTSP